MASPMAVPAQAPVDARFGVIESFDNPIEANNLGVAWTRVRFQWADVQAGGPGTWTPTVTDTQINGEISNGRTVVGLLIGVPEWAWDGGLPAGLWLPHNDPNNTWGNFVREAVSRYNGRINHWIIWNEPDINDPNAPGFTWHGSTNDFFQLQRTAYLVAKETNPNAVIHLPAFTHFWNPNYIYELMDIIVADPAAPDNNYYFDVLTAHLYFQPDSVFSLIQNFYGAVLGRGIPWKPLWLVETNAPPSNDPTWPVSNWTFQVTLDEQAAYIPQALVVAMAAGAQRIAVYKLQDVAGDEAANPEPFGLLRMDGSRRPAFNTYQVAIRYLAGVQGASRERWDHVGQVKLNQGTYTTHVLFSRLPAPQTAEIEATANTAVLVDMWGGRRTISAKDGIFTVDLPGAPCVQTAGDYCMIGGPVLYLVQATEGGELPGAPAAPGGPPPTLAAQTGTPEANASTSEAEPTTVPEAESPGEPDADDTAVPTNNAAMRPTHTPQPTQTIPPLPTNTAAPTVTLEPTTPVPAPEVAEVAPTPQPTTAQTTNQPAESGDLSFYLLGGGLLLVIGLAGWWWRNRRLYLFIFLPIILLMGLLVGPRSLSAQSDTLTILTNEMDDGNYPRNVTFHLDVDTAVPLTSATLTYDVNKFGCLKAATSVPVDVEDSTIEWTWEMVRSGNPPPGTSVSWFWTFTDANGQTITTDPQTHTFTDKRYDWQMVEADNLKLHWYEGEVGPTLLDASVEALDRLESEMGIELQDEVNIFIYGDTDDMRDAVLYIQDWAGGVAFTEYNVILIGVPPRLADTWGRNVVPHELAHLVVAQYGRSCLGGSRPTWLDEGLAVFAEGEPSNDIVSDIERGIENNSFEPLRSLNGAFSAHGPEAGIAYSQSYSVVDYMLATYGRDKMQQLILTLAGGKGYDEALETVYGFNVDGLEQAWRAYLGVPARAIPPTPTPLNAAAIPTVIPQGLPVSVPTPPAAAATAPALDTPPSSANPGICSLGLVPLLLLGLVFSKRQQRMRK